MKRLLFTSILFLIFTVNLFAQQKQGAWWHFGYFAGLNFNRNPPAPIASPNNSQYGSATISDANGSLLFSTSGFFVVNKNSQIMQNGQLGMNINTVVMIVPNPGNSALYYLFAATPLGGPSLSPSSIYYSEVDMRLDNGKGGILPATKNTLLMNNATSKITTCMHANNKDVWVIAHSLSGNSFYAYLITASGISAPVISQIGVNYGSSNPPYDFGMMKGAPNGMLIADAVMVQNVVQLCDFNKTTGALTNSRLFNFTKNTYGIAFSPDVTKLYLNDKANIYQYNLQLPNFSDVLSSKVQVNPANNLDCEDMQLATNGKIYVIPTKSSKSYAISLQNPHLSVINCPNNLGSACGYQDTTIYLGTGAGSNFPALNQTLFRNANILQLIASKPSICIGDSVKLSAFGAGADQFTWLPANGITPINSPEVIVSPSVTTTYTVIGYSQCDSDTASLTINVVPPAMANAGPNKTVCSGSPIQLGATAQTGFTYAWNSSPFLSDTTLANPTFTATNNTTSDQVYQLILTIDGPGVSCGKRTDTVQVTVKPQIIANAGAAISFCSGTSIQLNPQQFNSNYIYSWSPATGLSNANTFAPSLTLNNFSAQPDTVFYTLTASKDGCSASSQVRVVILPEAKPVITGSASVCPGSPQIAYKIQNASTGTTYTWGISGGSISQTFADSIWVNWGATSATAKIWVKAQNTFSCQSDTVFFPVIINPLLLTETPKGNDTLCANDRLNQVYQIARAQGSSYNWGLFGGTILSGQGSHLINVNWNGTGQHKLWVQESAQTSLAQCFGVSDTLRITVLPSPDSTLTVQGSASVCNQTTQTYFLNGNSASTYLWQVSGGTISSGQGSNSVNIHWQTVGLGELKVLETLPNGCVGIWRKLNVQVNPIPVTTFQTYSTFCPEALERTFRVWGMPGSTFQWQITGGTLVSGQGNFQATILWDSLATNHKYTVIETSASGCSSALQEVTVDFDRTAYKLLSVGLDEAEENLVMHYLMKNPPATPVAYIDIFAENDQTGKWEYFGSSLLTNTVFTKPVADYQARNYFISGKNYCSRDVYSLVHRPVKLSATANENSGEVRLSWNSYKGWQDTARYEIWRQLAGETQFSKLTVTTDSSLTLHTGRDGFQQRYRIKAVAKAGYESWSNSVGLSFENALEFPNVITPNNDGRNETFTAKSLLLYPNSSLKIYNRWGKEVFSSPDYQGNWNGQNQSSGTYYYLFQTKDGKSFKGWLEVVRD